MAASILTPFQKNVLHQVAKSLLSERFYLTGGTALAEFYLHHRLSEDLDFFSEEEFALLSIQVFIKKLKVRLKLTKTEYRNQFGLHTFFLHQNLDVLKIDFNYYPFPRIAKGIRYEKVEVDSLRDIAVNKLQTIATQPRSRDFIDLYCIIKKTGWTINELKLQARNKFDWSVDAIQLGSRMLQIKELKDYPHMLITFDYKECEEFWLIEAAKLKKEAIEE